MAFYCPQCNVRKVSRDGELCSSCQDPYQNMSAPAPFVQQPRAEQTQNNVQTQTPVQTYNTSVQNQHVDQADSADTAQPHDGYVTISRGRRSNAPLFQPSASPTPPTPPASSSVQTSAVKKKALPQAEGIVKNVTSFKDKSTAVEKWFRSLFSGVPFPIGDDAMEFQVFQNWNATANSSTGYAAEKVVVYGTISTGRPLQDNSVRVYGFRDKGHNIIATKVENTTDGTCTMFKPEPISATFIRIVTLLVLGLIVFLLLGASFSLPSIPGVQFNLSGLLTNLVLVLLGGMAVVFLFRKAKSSFGNNWMSFFGYCLGLLFALSIWIGMLRDLFHI